MSDKKPAGPILITGQTQKREASAAKPKPKVKKVKAQVAAPVIDPAAAPPVPDLGAALPQGHAMVAATQIAARPVSWLARLFWLAVLALIGLWITSAVWDFVAQQLARNIWLGRAALVLGAIVLIGALGFVIREMAGFSRLAKIDALRARSDEIYAAPDDKRAKAYVREIAGLYEGRDQTAWSRDDLKRLDAEVIDPTDRLHRAERALLAPLDLAAREEIEKAARQVATVTAIVPLALADVVAALVANVRMIRRIAEVYGGRSGTLGSWRLLRTVTTHLVATGAVGVADDLIGSVAGGGAVAKLSRRFGEGIINGALTARVGVAAMEVCRPMPFAVVEKPKVTRIVGSALTGLFGR